MSVALDSMILIWGLKVGSKKKATTQAVADKMARAIILLKDLETSGETVIIPTIVVSEFLRPIDYTQHGSIIEEFQKRFSIRPFDIPSSSWAARLWKMSQEHPEAHPPERPVLKSDLMIIATAIAAGVNVFYSHDAWCRKMATKAGLLAKDLPTHSESLIDDFEARTQAETGDE